MSFDGTDWTPTLCDALNSFAREHGQFECKDGPSAADLVSALHGYAGTLKMKLGMALEAVEAHLAWTWAEHAGSKLSAFSERVELCNYAEWLSARAMQSCAPTEYMGIPKILVWPDVLLHRATAEEARAIVDRILCDYRKSLAGEAKP